MIKKISLVKEGFCVCILNHLMFWLSLNFLVQRCDRILWYGEGLHQSSYVRGESRFSDHRPVYGIFWAEVESSHGRLKKSMSYSSSRIEVEELLPYAHGYTELNFFWRIRGNHYYRPLSKYALSFLNQSGKFLSNLFLYFSFFSVLHQVCLNINKIYCTQGSFVLMVLTSLTTLHSF